MKKYLIYIFWGIVAIALIYFFGAGKINNFIGEKSKEKVETERTLKVNNEIKEMIAKYDANTHWKKGLFFTNQFQEFLQNANARPVYIAGAISDIEKKQNGYILYLESGLFSSADIIYELSISPEQYKKILSMNVDKYSKFVPLNLGIIAHIKEIIKPSLFISAQAESAEVARVEVNSSYKIIRGECLAVTEENIISDFDEDAE